LPTVTLKAKEFAAAITDFNVRKEDLQGLKPITTEHVKNNKDVRAVLEKSDIKPEDLPSEEDIKKLQRQVQAQNKKLLKGEGSFREDFT
jgi:DNA-damage-inducible protein D